MMTDRLPPIETDPLGAIRKELLSAAWRQKARADRRRRMMTVASSLMLTFVCLVGGATAVGVDFPVVGDTLERLVAGRQDAERQSAGGEGDPTLPASPADVARVPESRSRPLEVPWGEGGSLTAAGYLDREGGVCFLLVRPGGAATAGACTPAELLQARLDSGVAFLQSVVSDRFTVASGFVEAAVDRVDVRGPGGALHASVGETWRPGGAGLPVRPFVAVGPAAGDGTSSALDLRDFVVEAHLRDGRTVVVRP
jgi:hypothetical protein